MIFPASLIGLSAIFLLGAGPAHAQGPACAADNEGWTLPKGFCAVVVAESLGPVRHIAVAPNGDVFAAVSGPNGGIRVLRDTNGDGRADLVAWFYQGTGGTGVALSGDAVYFAPNDRVLRLPWKPGELAPSGPPEIIVSGLPVGGHQAKGIVLGNGGDLFVSFGSATNSCQGDNDRKGAFPGIFPCPELPFRAGVWRFDLRRHNQTAADGTRWATGLRNPMALSLEPSAGIVYAAVHGRDQLAENWKWSVEAGRENPAETVFALTKGTDGGWPYCYVDSRQPLQLQNPEYGGDGAKIGNCDTKAMPALTFPGHWAPNATVFYTGTQFPPTYRGGLFIAFHGSWNRSPAPQEGYRVVFAPFAKGRAFGTSETFAAPSGLATSLRPSGLAVGPDGSLYIGADANAKVWRVIYIGN